MGRSPNATHSVPPNQFLQPFDALVLPPPEHVFPKAVNGQHPVFAELLIEISQELLGEGWLIWLSAKSHS